MPRFNWPTFAPGARVGSATTGTTSQLLACPSSVHSSSTTPSARMFNIMAIPSSILPIVTPIQQTKPLDLHSPPTSTLPSIPSPAPETTIDSFVLFTSSSSSSSKPRVTALTIPSPDPLPATSHPSAPASSALTPGAIAGISIGITVLLTALALLAFSFYRRHKRNTPQPDAEKLDIDALIEARIQRAREMASQRWSQRQTGANRERFEALKAKGTAKEKEVGVRGVADNQPIGNMEAKDGDRHGQEKHVGDGGKGEEDDCKAKTKLGSSLRRRPSGLQMHPPTPVTEASGEGKKEEENIGQVVLRPSLRHADPACRKT